jgi:hypothetical protein
MTESAATHLRRALALLVPCVATVLTAVAIAWWYRAPLVEESTKANAVERLVVPDLQRWASPASPGVVRGVFFGDSLTMSLDSLAHGGSKGGVPVLVEEALRAAGTPVDILALTHAAFRPVHLAYVLDEVLAGQPRFAVVELNLRLVAPTWDALPALRFLPLSRKLSTYRQIELAPYLREEGIGTFHPGVYRLQEALSLLYVMDGVRIAGHDWLGAESSRIERTLGLERNARPVQSLELNDDAKAYASRFAEGSSAAILRLLERDLAAAGVWALYYVSPLNPDALRAAGVADPAALSARIEELRAAAGVPAERWLDLHDGMPASAFLDQMNHLRPSALRTVATRVLHRLRPVIAGVDAPPVR